MHLSSPKHHAVSHGVRGRQCQHPQTTQCSVRRLSTRRQVAAQQGTPAAAAAQQLVEAAAGQQFGASSTAQQQQTLLRLVSDLKQHQQQAPTTGPLQGLWCPHMQGQQSRLCNCITSTHTVMLLSLTTCCAVWLLRV